MKSLILLLSIAAALIIKPSFTIAQEAAQADSVLSVITVPKNNFEVKDTTAKRRSFLGRLLFEEDTAAVVKKKFDFTIVAGPNYASDIKFAIGVVASGKYYTVRDGVTYPSTISQFASVSTTGFYTTAIRGNNFFKGNKNRIDYEMRFYSFPSDFWGFGYYAADDDDNSSSYKRIQVMCKSDFLHELVPNLYAGVHLEYFFVNGIKFKDPAMIAGYKRHSVSYGYGATICYDTRDYIPNAYKGIVVKATQINYVEPNQKPYYKTILTSSYFKQIWQGGILALDCYSEFTYGKVPWTMLSLMGGSYRMRGYYEGRYRDKNLVCVAAELRQRVWKRHGIAFWTGGGNIWGLDKFNWGHTLPNVGIGYRLRLKNRTSLRLDYGIGKHMQTGFIFQIDEAF